VVEHNGLPINLVRHYAQVDNPATVTGRVFRMRICQNVTMVQIGDVTGTLFLRVPPSVKISHVAEGDFIQAYGNIQRNSMIRVQEVDVIAINQDGMFDINYYFKRQKSYLRHSQIIDITAAFFKQQGFLNLNDIGSDGFAGNALTLDIPRAFGWSGRVVHFFTTKNPSFKTHEDLLPLLQLLINTIQNQLGLRKFEPIIPSVSFEESKQGIGLRFVTGLPGVREDAADRDPRLRNPEVFYNEEDGKRKLVRLVINEGENFGHDHLGEVGTVISDFHEYMTKNYHEGPHNEYLGPMYGRWPTQAILRKGIPPYMEGWLNINRLLQLLEE
jgi:hypothetical protein